jgi:hypothetical protein
MPPSVFGLYACTCVGTLPRWEPINVTTPGQNYKYSSWHHFHYSQGNRHSSFTCQRSLMAEVTEYCHVGSQHGGVPTHVQARRPDNEGGVGRAGLGRMKM